jgi:c-di-GMP-binding flagellar brake protein YcgR
MLESKSDKRARSRIPVSVPARVRSKDTEQEHTAITRDLSIGGVFLYTDRNITQGSKLEIILILPSELGLGEKQWACCQASVVRVEDGQGKGFGVAARIDRLDMLPEIPS